MGYNIPTDTDKKRDSDDDEYEGISVQTPEIDIKPHGKAPPKEKFQINLIKPEQV